MNEDAPTSAAGAAAPADAAHSRARGVCSYCGVGCGLLLQIETDPATRRRRVASVKGDPDHPANRGRMCTKGATSADAASAPGRLESALIRPERGAAPIAVGVADAVAEAVARLRTIIDAHGPDSVALYVSGQMTLEAQYLATKLAKGYLRTNGIESNSRLCMASAGAGYKAALGSDAPPGSYDDFDHADVFLVTGANMADCHPILFLRMMERVRAGAKLIVVDPRRTPTAEKADLHLQIAPGTDLAMLHGLLHLIVAEGHIDPVFIGEFTDGWVDAGGVGMEAFLADYSPAVVAALTGLSEADLRTAARWIGEAENWMTCWTMGLNQSTQGTANTTAICNLHLATGAIARTGSGPFSLTGQPNAMGGREMGYLGPGLPGQRSVLIDADRAFMEKLWGLPAGTIPTQVGSGTIDLFEKLSTGQIKAVWVICTNPVVSIANRDLVLAGLANADLVIVQECFGDAETTAYADIVLPAALWTEVDGVFVNSERNLTLLTAVADPPGEALADWDLIARVGRGLGFGDAFDYDCAEQIFDELRGAANPATGWDIRGVTYDRLRTSPVQWPSPPGDTDTRHPIRYLNDGTSHRELIDADGNRPRLVFATANGRAVFHARPHLGPAEAPDQSYPLVLTTGRLAHQWHTMTKTGKVAKLNRLNPGPFVEIHPTDAAHLGIGDGDAVEIVSRRGRAVLPARVEERTLPGTCFAPFHWGDAFGMDLAINVVTSDAVDPVSFQPEFKHCAVALSRIGTTLATEAPSLPVPASSDAASAQGTTPSGTSDYPLAAVAAALGLGVLGTPDFTEQQRHFLAGLFWAVERGGSIPSMLAPDAPFTGPVRAWVDGVLTSLAAPVMGDERRHGETPLESGGQSSPDPVAPAGSAGAASSPAMRSPGGERVLLAWASQTGNAEDFATGAAALLRRDGLQVDLVVMDEVEVATIAQAAYLVIVTSTFGDGDAPDNGAAFWGALCAAGAPELPDTSFAVLAFGDPVYADFCGHGRRLDERLAALGATRLLARVDLEVEDRARAANWLTEIRNVLRPTHPDPPAPPLPPAAPDPAPAPLPARAATSEPPVAIAATASDVRQAPSADVRTAGGYSSQSFGRQVPDGHTGAAQRPFSRQRPLPTRLVTNQALSGAGSVKDVRKFAFALESGCEYEAGDAIGVWPKNDAAVVQEWLTVTGLDGGAVVEIDGVGATDLRTAATEHLDIVRITPALLRFAVERKPDRELSRLLRPHNVIALEQWLWGRQSMDLLTEYPVRAEPTEWLEVLKRLTPRLYSISGSPKVSAVEVELTVSAVRYAYSGRSRHGVCSTYLADRCANETVPVFVQRSPHFRPPADNRTPMIMIGPGTGVAPFRAFLQERRALGHHGRNWLFFGEQRAATDFYYRAELEEFYSSGLLTRLSLAFSRDQRQKVYVQDLMRAAGLEFWRWLDAGAHVYVCGDAGRMAKDVHAVLIEIVRDHGGLGERAEEYVRSMATQKRYVRDVY
ncbi:MAG: molybdopterin-dependent oxidoreductase [Sporichthyaceae bacterium]